jgi:hypothetical protein
VLVLAAIAGLAATFWLDAVEAAIVGLVVLYLLLLRVP